jgi:hypothetical protein
MTDLPILAAGREIPDALDRIRRYCGLPWTGGPPETWAWAYYDEVPSVTQDTVEALDVLAAGALHSGLRRDELEFFKTNRRQLDSYLRELPADEALNDAAQDTLAVLDELPTRFPQIGLALLSKVLHRKRPHLIPLVDHEIADHYRMVTGERSAVTAWPKLLRSVQADLSSNLSRVALELIADELRQEMADSYAAATVTDVRLFDIAVWMGGAQ